MLSEGTAFGGLAAKAAATLGVIAAVWALGDGPTAAQTRFQGIAANLPENFDPNSCYARVFIPPTTASRQEPVIVRDAYEQLLIEEARYREVERQVVIRPAYERVDYTAPRFEKRQQVIELIPQKEKVTVIPPEFTTEDVAVPVRDRFETWDTQCSPVSRLDNATGEVLCRKVVPPLFKTVEKRVVSRPARLERESVAAKTVTVDVQVMVQPAQERRIQVPAETRMVRVQELVAPLRQARQMVPAEVDSVPVEVKATDGRVEWREVLCDQVASASLVRDVQRALRRRGFNPGPVDGVMGPRTRAALNTFQRREGLSEGGLLIETLNRLGVRARG